MAVYNIEVNKSEEDGGECSVNDWPDVFLLITPIVQFAESQLLENDSWNFEHCDSERELVLLVLTVQQYGIHSWWIMIDHIEDLHDPKHTSTSYISLRIGRLKANILPVTTDLSTLVCFHQLLVKSLDYYFVFSYLRVVLNLRCREDMVSFFT